MKFVPHQGGWRLVEDAGLGEPVLLATLKNEVEVLAIKRFCQAYESSGSAPSSFDFSRDGVTYRAYCLGQSGDKLRLHLTTGGQLVAHIETEFVLH